MVINTQCDMIFELFKDKSASFLASIFQDMILRAKSNFSMVYYSEIWMNQDNSLIVQIYC